MLRLVSVLLLSFGFAALQPGARDGRAGNRLLAEGDVRGAAAAFRTGTERAGVPDDLAFRLWHNLGLALASDTTDTAAPPPDSLAVPADSAFAQALRLAADPADRARIAYDAGTAALIAGDAAAAVTLLRRALVLAPDRLDARRNYEIARRQIASDPPTPTPPEPSEEARRIKARADALVAERRYRDALDTMTEGLARDSTVAAFSDFTDRLGKVVEIEEDPSLSRGDAAETTRPAAPVAPPPPTRPPAPAGPTRL